MTMILGWTESELDEAVKVSSTAIIDAQPPAFVYNCICGETIEVYPQIGGLLCPRCERHIPTPSS